MKTDSDKAREYLRRADLYTYMGRIDKIVGTTVEATGMMIYILIIKIKDKNNS